MNPYLKKYSFQPSKITLAPAEDLGIILVIPCHNEKQMTRTLDSIENCMKPSCNVKVIVVVNQSEVVSKEIDSQNKRTIQEISEWCKKEHSIGLEVIDELSLPKKHAGVGLARKIGMDEAVNLFHQIDRDGIIVALDADCEVEKNYLVEIEKHFNQFPTSPGCSIRYAHPVEGEEYSDKIYKGIIQYELHLRYYNQALKYCGLPYAYHTVGSSMAVKSSAYQKQGGMNKRKAGEDFYFLQKIIELGNFTEINTTCVIPSPRVSDRVPFGTGKAIGDWLMTDQSQLLTYNFRSFVEVKSLISNLTNIYKRESYQASSQLLIEFLTNINFQNKVKEIKRNTTNYTNFEKRFFTFFNAFTMLKFVHYSRDNYYPNLPVEMEAQRLMKTVFQKSNDEKSAKGLLELYRVHEKSGRRSVN